MTIKEIQEDQKAWVKHNFGERPSWNPLLGIMEELGELSHAHLKAVQGIRVNEDHNEAKKDAVADLVIYLCDYCSAEGIDLESTVSDVWQKVRQRDWKRYPKTGMP